MVGSLKINQVLICLLVFITLGRFSFAQGIGGVIDIQSNPVEKTVVINKSSGPTERFSLVLNSVRSVCAQKYPYPSGVDSSGRDVKDLQMCQRLEVRGKRIECEINQIGEQNAKGDIFGPESQPSLKDWAQCTGKIALILEQGFYISAGEIDRRVQFCNNQFFHHPGEAPKLSLIDRFRKSFARPDYQSQNIPTVDKPFFDKSTLQVNDQRIGLSKCEYLLPLEKNGPSLRSEVSEVNPLMMLESRKKNSEQDFVKSETKKEIVSPRVKSPNLELNKKQDLKKKEDVKNISPIGECRRPLKDCPK